MPEQTARMRSIPAAAAYIGRHGCLRLYEPAGDITSPFATIHPNEKRGDAGEVVFLDRRLSVSIAPINSVTTSASGTAAQAPAGSAAARSAVRGSRLLGGQRSASHPDTAPLTGAINRKHHTESHGCREIWV